MDKWFKAAQTGNVEELKELLDQGADINEQDQDGQTALHEAARNGHVRIVELLLNRNADTDIKDNNRNTALHYAADNGHIEIGRIISRHNYNQPSEHLGRLPIKPSSYLPRSAKVIKVIEVRFLTGDGSEEDVWREAFQYWSLDGELLVENLKEENRG